VRQKLDAMPRKVQVIGGWGVTARRTWPRCSDSGQQGCRLQACKRVGDRRQAAGIRYGVRLRLLRQTSATAGQLRLVFEVELDEAASAVHGGFWKSACGGSTARRETTIRGGTGAGSAPGAEI
jgi:hypothetical protein